MQQSAFSAQFAASLGLGLSLLVAAPAVAQTNAVGGIVVTGPTERPVAGAQVAIRGTGRGAVTDNDGRFRIADVEGATTTLDIRRIGYRAVVRSVRVGDLDIRVPIIEAAVELNEVVVTGTAGAQEKRSIGTSVAKVNAVAVQEIAPAPSITSLINGRAPGVVVVPGTGVVGGGPRIRIRGAASFSLSDQPLLYIDGVRVANDVSTGPRSQFFGSGVVSRLGDIDPDDIESIEIIKGPAAATLYGTEANNGVIQVITKRGRAGRTHFTATVRQGAQWFMNAENRIPETLSRDPVSGATLSWNPVKQEEARGTPLFKTGQIQNYNVALGGGSDLVRYYLSSSYDRDTGIEPSNHLWRYSGSANLQVSPYKNIDVSASLGITQQKINVPLEAGGGMWFSAFFGQAPTDSATRLRRGFFSAPPEAFWNAFNQYQSVNRFTGSVQLSHRLGQWFTHRLTVGNDITGEDNIDELERLGPYERNFFTNPVTQGGTKFTRRRELSYATLDYSGTVSLPVTSTIHSNTSLGAQYYRRREYALAARGEGFPAAGLTVVDATATTFGGEALLENSTVGFFGQQQFDLSNRIFLTGALRVDNNSAFGDDFKWVTYPKVSATWVINEEPWWSLGWVNTLKLRAAYGQTGQQPQVNSALRTFAAITGGLPGGAGQAAVTPSSPGNANLAPERAGEIEVGFDAGLLGDRVGAEVSYYNRKTRDAILSRDLAPSGGFPGQQFVNIGGITSSGIELGLRATLISRPQFGWDAAFNFSHNTNEVTDLGNDPITGKPLEFIQIGAQRNQIGSPVRSYYDLRVVSATFDANGNAINAMCDDAKGGTTACLDARGQAIAPRVFLGRPDAPTEGSVSNTFTLWRRLRLYGLVDFKRGHTQLDNNLRARCQVFRLCDFNLNPTKYDPGLIAQVQSTGVLRNFVYNDASFAKLREVSASFALPESYVRRIGASGASFTLSARNLHTWTKWTGVDPESYFVTEQFLRTEQAQTPQLAQFITSLTLTF
ncbi:MAG: SusC/RagA family TonB-linked outer membrane protein [Gemmatimonadaceae bacterium]